MHILTKRMCSLLFDSQFIVFSTFWSLLPFYLTSHLLAFYLHLMKLLVHEIDMFYKLYPDQACIVFHVYIWLHLKTGLLAYLFPANIQIEYPR